MYKLTLTYGERLAFDFVKGKYETGEIGDVLVDYLPEDKEWSSMDDITFEIPEHKAWEIMDIAFESEENNSATWPMFELDLVIKMEDFLNGIV